MDGYLVKNELNAPNTSKMLRPKASGMKNQRTLSDLKRVVIMEDIQKCKNILSNPDIYPHAAVVECLSVLLNKLPNADILRKTKIGRIVKKLNSHSNQEVAFLSKNIVDVWSQDIRKRSSMKLLDVRCDLKTKNNREAAKRFLLEAFFKRTV
uniref:TFIIS N-terminal domain-containing protein n=1 Tax=Romanomermis culicivorax TaxID=13658 RepID=A0A915HPY5_ROMCU